MDVYIFCSRQGILHDAMHHLHPGGPRLNHHHHRARQVAAVSGDDAKKPRSLVERLYCRRQYAESWRKMQELRAQIQAQLKLADTLKKISEAAGRGGGGARLGEGYLVI